MCIKAWLFLLICKMVLQLFYRNQFSHLMSWDYKEGDYQPLLTLVWMIQYFTRLMVRHTVFIVDYIIYIYSILYLIKLVPRTFCIYFTSCFLLPTVGDCISCKSSIRILPRNSLLSCYFHFFNSRKLLPDVDQVRTAVLTKSLIVVFNLKGR